MERVRRVLLTLSLDRVQAIARSCGAAVEDGRVRESVVDGVVEAIRGGSLSIPSMLQACTKDELLRMRVSAGLGDGELRESVPELLRYLIERSLDRPEGGKKQPTTRSGRTLGATDRSETLEKQFARRGVREMRLHTNPNIDDAGLSAPATRDELLALADNELTPESVRDAARELAKALTPVPD